MSLELIIVLWILWLKKTHEIFIIDFFLLFIYISYQHVSKKNLWIAFVIFIKIALTTIGITSISFNLEVIYFMNRVWLS